ncbi:MAG: thiamine-phosphate kinase [Candidatus Omnitrophota bacterium]
MLLSKIGEFGLIERIKKTIKNDPTVIIGPGDDCAVLKYNKNNYQLFSTDMLVEGVDFTKDTNPYLVGRKALAVSISDISACGGIPTQAVVSLGLPKDITLSSVDRINKGINDLAKIYKINIVGGDISLSRDFVINVSILGIV